jgi:hypothetical protein
MRDRSFSGVDLVANDGNGGEGTGGERGTDDGERNGSPLRHAANHAASISAGVRRPLPLLPLLPESSSLAGRWFSARAVILEATSARRCSAASARNRAASNSSLSCSTSYVAEQAGATSAWLSPAPAPLAALWTRALSALEVRFCRAARVGLRVDLPTVAAVAAHAPLFSWPAGVGVAFEALINATKARFRWRSVLACSWTERVRWGGGARALGGPLSLTVRRGGAFPGHSVGEASSVFPAVSPPWRTAALKFSINRSLRCRSAFACTRIAFCIAFRESGFVFGRPAYFSATDLATRAAAPARGESMNGLFKVSEEPIVGREMCLQ